MSMTRTQIKTTAAAFVRSIRARLNLADTSEAHSTIADDIASFLAGHGSDLLTDPQIRNLARMQRTAERRALELA